MSWTPRKIAVVGATGPTGTHLARELARRGRSVVAVSRRLEQLQALFREEELEVRAGDALDGEALARAVDGCELVVDCIGLPPERMADHPRTARGIAAAAARTGARCLQVSSYWAFFPHRGEVVNEQHPRSGGHQWFRMRREAEDVMLAAGAAVVHLPDFFGPLVHTSTVQLALEDAAAGRPVQWFGPAAAARDTIYVPDAMRIVADLSERQEAYGTDWALPGNEQLSAERLAEVAGQALGRPVSVRTSPAWLLRLLSWVHPGLRKIRPMVPHYVRPVRYDAAKLRSLLGAIELTSLEQAIGETLRWIASR